MLQLLEVLIRGLFEFGGELIGSTARGAERLHGALERMFSSLENGLAEWLFGQPIECFDGGCWPGTLATATMLATAVFFVMAMFERFRWSRAFWGWVVLFFLVVLVGRFAAQA